MTTHGKRHAKQDIMDAAWKLFTEQGYDETTISQIIELSGKSRSTFYHHFRGKDELLFSLAYSYDSDYDSWLQTCDRTLQAADLLLAFNHFVLNNLEHSPYMDLFASLYGLQVATTGTRHILNPDRNYYKILRKILFDGYKVFCFLFGQNDCIANLSFYYFTGLLNQIFKIIDIYIFTGNY